ncbi:MAG: CRISPR-associated endonuclease Cas2 [bacterium]
MICYDIADPKRLKKVSHILEDYGVRTQYSFFQCEISKDKANELIKILTLIIDKNKDSLFIYPLCESCNKKVIFDGTGEVLKIESFEII